MDNFIFVIGFIGILSSILVFASPMRTFRKVVKQRSTEDYKGAPFIATFLCTSLWTFYGMLKPGGFVVVMVNVVGVIFHCIYILLFLIYSPQDKKVKMVQLVCILDVGFLATMILVTLFVLPRTIQLTFLGTLCSGLTIIMYASPLLAMKMVIKTKSVEYMPFTVSFSMFLNASVWTLYSVFIRDLFILIPNFIGLILGLTQVTLYVIFKKKTLSSSGPTLTLGLVKSEMANMIEKEDLEYEEAKVRNGAMEVAEKAIKRVKSLPGPMVNHPHTIRKVVRGLSIGPSNSSNILIDYQPYQDEVDVEIGADTYIY